MNTGSNFERMLQIVLEMQYNDGVQAAEEKNKALEKQAEAMRLSILGTNEESRDDKPLGVVEAYVKENTTELIDPLRAEKRVAKLKKRRRDCCLNWKQRSRSPMPPLWLNSEFPWPAIRKPQTCFPCNGVTLHSELDC